MMTTLLTTIADALIEFILSLLRDPAALDEFKDDPEGTLARNGLGGVCAADVQAVKPVVIDHPQVQLRADPPPQVASVHYTSVHTDPVVREITTMAQSFHFDNRSTIVDQSVNQSIWAEGDVTQDFDHEAVISSGDGSNAAGHDVDNSTTDTTAGDISIGNKDTSITVDGSYNDSSTDTSTSIDTTIDTGADDGAGQTDPSTAAGDAVDQGSSLAAATTTDAVADADEDGADASSDAPAAQEPADAAPAEAVPAEADAAPDPAADAAAATVIDTADVGLDDAGDDGGAYPETESPADVSFDEP